MKRITLAALTAITLFATAPAVAMPITINFPTLTYPPKTQPQTTQSCADHTTLDGETCTVAPK